MIRTLMHIDWINLKRDRVALGLSFVLPVVFFSIFAVIFGGMSGGSGGGAGSIRVIVVDEDDTEVSRRFAESLGAQNALSVFTAPRATEEDPEPPPYTRDDAQKRVRSGNEPVAVIIPDGFGESFGNFVGERAEVELIYDAANPIALHTTGGLIQAASMMAAPDILMESGLKQLELAGGFLTDEQKKIIEDIKPALRGEVPWDSMNDEEDGEPADGEENDANVPPTDAEVSPTGAASDDESEPTSGGFQGLVSVTTTDARAGVEEEKKPASIITYYAAAIGVMFLLFSMAGASGSILDDEERGTLERLLTTRLNMGTLLMGHWVFYAVIGFVQLGVMFLWGELVFGIELFTIKHVSGFVLMAAFTAAAAAAFGLFLATLCKTRAQLGGISTIVILIMSALGGSMVPRMVAPFLEKTSRYTFNGWALDGFQKVFWRDVPAHTLLESWIYLWPQLLILTVMTVVMLFVTRVASRRWESS